MSTLMIAVQRKAHFTGIDEARMSLCAIARELGATSVIGGVWTRFRGVLLALDEQTVDLLLVENRSHRADQPGQPTYVIPLNATPAGPEEIGLISLRMRRAEDRSTDPRASAGLQLSVNLADTAFKSDADALLRLLGGCFDTALADSGTIGPRAWVKELGKGWLTATRRSARDWLPSGATMVPTQTGSIVIAHREEPGSTSTSAREAVGRVHDALNGASARVSVPAPRTAPVPAPQQESISLQSVQSPPYPPPLSTTHPVALLPPALRSASDLSRTISVSSLPAPDRPPADPLPFGNTPSAEFVASLSMAGSSTPHPAVGETLPLGANLLSSMRPMLPFNQPASVPAPMVAKQASWPSLTLDSYASLCAELSVFPARAADILRKYGIADDTARRGIDQHWRDLFTTAPILQEEWQRKVTAFCDWLRSGGR